MNEFVIFVRSLTTDYRTFSCAGLLLVLTGCNLWLSESIVKSTTEESRDLTQTSESHLASTSLADEAGGLRQAKDGVVFSDLTFRRIPAGQFQMGAESAVVPLEYCFAEMPAHRVSLSRDFLMSETEVTVGLYRSFVEDTGYTPIFDRPGLGCNSLNLKTGEVQRLEETTWRTPGFRQTDQHPVVCLSQQDAVAFCQWFSQKHQQKFRLPTEAEWEYACRAGSRTLFAEGNQVECLDGHANVGDMALSRSTSSVQGVAPWDDGFAFTAPVASFRPNAFGLYDMHGNVGEWCADWFDAAYYESSPESDPSGPKWPRRWHVVRGGSWFNTPLSCRCSGRHDCVQTMPSTTNGFRLVMDLPEHE